MTAPIRQHCCDERRRNAVAGKIGLNGIDYLEVVDGVLLATDPLRQDPLRQRTLLLTFLKPISAGDFTREQVAILGGERVRDPAVSWVALASEAAAIPLKPPFSNPGEQKLTGHLQTLSQPDHVLVVRTALLGDHSPYRLRLRRSPQDDTTPAGFDPPLCEIDFSFKVECPSELDCQPQTLCPQDPVSTTEIDYLARDYPRLRRLVLDRLSLLVPDWQERSAADLGVTLAELIAYVGDQLAYQQDAVATEAYLNTARLRTSLRRHALLVDYHVHEGCNARVWLQLRLQDSAVSVNLPQEGTRFYTRVPGLPPGRLVPDSPQDREALRSGPVIFEPLHEATLYPAHDEMRFHTWGDARCCLPIGSTSATLAGHCPALKPGDPLLLEEVKGPLTGDACDADPRHRHVVRLTQVRAFSPDDDDPAAPLTDPLSDEPITEVSWHPEDALPFPLCLSSLTDTDHGEVEVANVSVARGNLVLADHGYTLPEEEELGTVPEPHLTYPPDRDTGSCDRADPLRIPPRFRPQLRQGPLPFAGTVRSRSGSDGSERVPFDPGASASAAMHWHLEEARPAITLTSHRKGISDPDPEPWTPRGDLLSSDSADSHFVVEMEHDGSARLRFGDDVYGRRPTSGTQFQACYRIGNGPKGNVGAETIAHVVSPIPELEAVRNPLAACGGTAPEDAATVRRRAPQAFRRQERAVTPQDYADMSQRFEGVERAAATLRWTGSWSTVFVSVDRSGGRAVDAGFEADLRAHLERYRMAGHDLEVNDPVFVSLEIELLVCVQASFHRSDVRIGLLRELGNRRLPDGRLGLFHPDRLSFGQTVFLGPIYAAARTVAGIDSLQATTFQRQGRADPKPLADGFLSCHRLEIPRLDNDPSFPERGVLRLNLIGGL